VFEEMSMRAGPTVCNMSSVGARAGLVRRNDKPSAISMAVRSEGADWDATLAWWKSLPTDPGATFDKSVAVDAGAVSRNMGHRSRRRISDWRDCPTIQPISQMFKWAAAAKALIIWVDTR
jgi:homoaconitase/3-isopropylmalate dehydratase large subunit